MSIYYCNFDVFYYVTVSCFHSSTLIYKFIEEAYSAVIQGPLFNESIYNAARFILTNIGARQPLGISKVYICYSLSILGFRFEAFKTAR